MISFNQPPYVGKELDYIAEAVASKRICGDGMFNLRCAKWLEERVGCPKALLTTSCTHALEMSAILLDIKEGDEVIMPSYTFVSTANAFVSHGAKVVFVDIRPDTMNMDEKWIEAAITPKTKAIVCVHYAGVACEMDTISDIAHRHNLYVVEDDAQGICSMYHDKPLGSFGDLACLSFHETKNLSMGEGGALLINNPDFVDRAEIIREKGTNRVRFFRGEVDKYSWVDIGSSYLPSELNAAYLWAQLECADRIIEDRMRTWNRYYEHLTPLAETSNISLPVIPADCRHNAHMFYIKTKDLAERTALLKHLQANGVGAVFHYVPLHSSEAGRRYGRFHGKDRHTTTESDRLIRLPMYYGLAEDDAIQVIERIKAFFGL